MRGRSSSTRPWLFALSLDRPWSSVAAGDDLRHRSHGVAPSSRRSGSPTPKRRSCGGPKQPLVPRFDDVGVVDKMQPRTPISAEATTSCSHSARPLSPSPSRCVPAHGCPEKDRAGAERAALVWPSGLMTKSLRQHTHRHLLAVPGTCPHASACPACAYQPHIHPSTNKTAFVAALGVFSRRQCHRPMSSLVAPFRTPRRPLTRSSILPRPAPRIQSVANPATALCTHLSVTISTTEAQTPTKACPLPSPLGYAALSNHPCSEEPHRVPLDGAARGSSGWIAGERHVPDLLVILGAQPCSSACERALPAPEMLYAEDVDPEAYHLWRRCVLLRRCWRRQRRIPTITYSRHLLATSYPPPTPAIICCIACWPATALTASFAGARLLCPTARSRARFPTKVLQATFRRRCWELIAQCPAWLSGVPGMSAPSDYTYRTRRRSSTVVGAGVGEVLRTRKPSSKPQLDMLLNELVDASRALQAFRVFFSYPRLPKRALQAVFRPAARAMR
uniref:Uncharacterized protein n=1 Tax=Mycena chlorophos TaxID=658473 RepID=A0ABQ0L073_MYCCL|nr:predicted protein [Mycena chlorophos]